NISNNASINLVVSNGACVIPIGLAANSCGATGLMKNSYIYCETTPGVQDFEYEFSGGDLSAPILYRRTNWFTDFNLSWIPQLNYGQTYDVRVRAKVANTWGVFANICTIGLAAIAPVPQLAGSSCGVSGLNLNNYIYTASVPGAQDYEYRFVNTLLGYTGTRVRGSNYTDLCLRWVTGLRYGQTYDVTVRAKINGVWGSFGPMCQVTLQAFPSTGLTVASCGTIDLMPTDRIYCNAVAGATNYQYRLTPPSGPAIVRNRNAATTDFYMQYAPGLTASTTYTVEVRAYAGGEWGTFADMCTVTTSASYGQSARMDFDNPTTAGEVDSESTMLMYPNPVGDNTLHLQLDGYNTSTAVVEIYDMSGRLVLSQQAALSMGSALVDLNIESLQTGMYMVTIIAGEERITKQLVVDK
ncbi:MAG TPA: T9SS type A sorting domain-containing protein, partial [Bacteroidia bacterium]|nr:T9SS type A sorting domain-containing protein [Bacteroidia bacterium]